MRFQHILITGGAGFVGSNLAVLFRRDFPEVRVTAFDNLHRRGSELSLPRLREVGVEFVHGDIRSMEDLDRVGPFDLLLDCSAEPSVHAGASGSPREVLGINLLGTINCLEAARKAEAALLFLSTSRVYPIAPLNAVPWIEDDERFRWAPDGEQAGITTQGVTEEFPLPGARSFYGASKLASELLITEYQDAYGLPALINRCGVLAGPWQMGKVDQGVVTLWVARHYFEKPLRYIGFGGSGKQVRDILHVEDLYDLIIKQIERSDCWEAPVYNVGGGMSVSLSLRELTKLCQAVTGHVIEMTAEPETNPLDVRIFITDTSEVQKAFDWSPQRDASMIVSDIHQWIARHESELASVLG